MAAVTTYPMSGNPYVDGLLTGVKWAVGTLTFSFPASASLYGASYGYGEPTTNFGALNAAQEAAARVVFGNYASATNLNFREIPETSTQHADLRLAMSDAPATAWAYLPTTAPEGGDMWFNKSKGYYDLPRKGNYAFATFLHETGHALGLEHPHEGNVMPRDRDSLEYTVMSYRSFVGEGPTSGYTNESWGFPQSLMMYDIAALQHMYGANFNTNAGNTTYSWSPTTGEMFVNGAGQGAPGANRVFLTVWDGGGVDTYDFSNYSTNLRVDLTPGEWTTTSATQLARLHYDGSKIAVGNIANALPYQGDARSLIENATGGSGNDTIIGNVAGNTLRGGAGNDTLLGGNGSDVLVAGPGTDLIDGGAMVDTAVLNLNLRNATSFYADRSLVLRWAGEDDMLRWVEQLNFPDATVVQADGYAVLDDVFYFTRNRDVLAAGMEPEHHFALFGWKEGRDPNPFYDTRGYLTTYPDVAAAGVDPLDHYYRYGWREGRDPSVVFDTNGYLRQHPDVEAAGMNPLEHYLQFGVYEGRSIVSDYAFA